MGRLLLIAVRNLFANRRKNLLLAAAILAVTLLLTLLGSIGNGIQHTMIEAGTSMISGHVNVGGFYKITSGRAAPVLIHRQQLLDDIREALPEAEHIVDRTRGWAKIVSDTDSVQSSLTGIDVVNDHAIRRVLTILDGSLDDLSEPGTVLLFQKQAERLGVGVGDPITFSAPVLRGVNNSLDGRVVAIAKDLGLLSIMSSFTSRETVTELYLLDPDTTGVFHIYLADKEDAQDTEARLREALTAKDYPMMEKQDGPFWHKFQVAAGEEWTGQRLDLTTWEQELSMLEWTTKTFSTVTLLLTVVLMFIIVIGVMNTLWITIRERTREIGTLRAIGMGRFKVLVMVLLEVAVLAAGATALGVLAGAGLSHALNAAHLPVSEGFQVFLMSETLKLKLDPSGVLNTMLWIPFLITFCALFPALRAARMKPITAIHHVG